MLAYIVFFYLLYKISVSDMLYLKIPNGLLFILFLLELFFLKAKVSSGIFYSISFFIIYILGNIFSKEIIGAGDIKLIFVVGSILNKSIIDFYYFVFFVTLFAIFYGSKREKVPLAPAICLTTLLMHFK